MSTLQHINSVIDHFWPEYRRRFPAFDKPEIVPAETLRGMAPVYMRRNIDQDPSSFYMFVRANPMNGDCSRDKFKEFVDDLFYEKLGMPSSYDMNAGGEFTREEAIDREVLPAARDSEYQRFYDEQMAAMERARAEEERKARAEKLGFNPDDPDIIDVDDEGNVGGGQAGTTAVGQAQTTAVDLPKQIWYAVDFHCPSGGMLGYDGGGRLGHGGGRGPRGYLREAYGREMFQARLQPAVDKFAGTDLEGLAKLFAGFVDAQSVENDFAFLKTVVSVAACGPAAGASAGNAKLHEQYDLFILRDSAGKFTWVECDPKYGSARRVWDRIDSARSRNLAATYQLADCQSYGPAEIKPVVDAIGEALRAGRGFDGKFLAEEDEGSDPEKMMKEFVEKKENGEVEEDEYRRPKDQPHNLHRADESGEVAPSVRKAAEGIYGEDEDRLDESFVQFAGRLIRG